MHTETLYAHILLNQPGLGSKGLFSLHKQFGSFVDILSARSAELPPRSRNPIREIQLQLDPLLVQARQTIAALTQSGASLLCLSDSSYPSLLREIPSPPPLLYVLGDTNALSLPSIAIVGSRNASRSGIEFATSFSTALASGGFAITSGLALGIDGAAHCGALRHGTTIAVVGTGIDQVYPRRHSALAAEIVAKGGAIVSEFPPGTPPMASNFPRRNRIISGLSTGVLVVEAAIKSGSLITARQAMEQGREVFAIPGSVNNPLARGCHQLLREGATLVETATDIVDQLGGMLSFKLAEAKQLVLPEPANVGASLDVSTDSSMTKLLNAMDYDPVDLDTLVEHSGIQVAEINGLLVELEIQGIVENRGGLYLRIR